nr:uncharacterized protein LOC113695508 [Coffea arabica]
MTTHRGEPAVVFSAADIAVVAAPFRYTLVGKFSKGRPLLPDLRKFLSTLDLKDTATVGLLDDRHVLLKFQCEADFLRVWGRSLWYVNGSPMRVFKWTSKFHVNRESSLAPVWFRLPKLPIHLFAKPCLFHLVSCLGTPLFVDAATSSFSRPNVARVCVEVDLLKSIPSRVWVDMGDGDGFWQVLIPENLPNYCSHCYRQGHGENHCRVKHPDLRLHKTQEDLVTGVMGAKGRSSPANTQRTEDEERRGVSEGDGVKSGATQNSSKSHSEGSLHVDTPTTAVGDASCLLNQLGGSTVVLVEKGIEAAADAILHAMADRVIGEPEEELEGTANTGELALVELNVVAGPGMMEPIEGAAVLGQNCNEKAVKHGKAKFVVVDQREGPCDHIAGNDCEESHILVEQILGDGQQQMADNTSIRNQNAENSNWNKSDGSQAFEKQNLGDDNHQKVDTTDPDIALPLLVVPSTSTRTETKTTVPQNPVPAFKDVFEEVKWEKLHGTLPRPHQISFIRSSITCNNDKKEEEDDSQHDKHKDQDQNLVQQQFTQVISKKAKKQLSKKGKTMQTRQDLKPNSNAHSQSHKCGAPSCG